MINKFGLYENIVPRHKILGLKSDAYDLQFQGWWLPFFKDKEIYLVDTYHIGYDTKKSLEEFIEDNENDKDNSWLINKADWDYYYGGSIKITPAIEGCFREVCDLRHFEVTKDDPNDYEEEDIVRNVQLWFEHGYPMGVTLKRKNASKSINKQALNKIYKVMDKIHTSWISDYDISELEGYLTNTKTSEEVKIKLEAFLKLVKRVIECNKLINEAENAYRNEINKIRNEDEE